MRDSWGQEWTDRSSSPAWGSRTVALVITAALFAAALASMSSLGTFPTIPVQRSTDEARLVYVTPAPRVERPEPRPVHPQRTRSVEATRVPALPRQPASANAPGASVAAPTAPVEPHRDSSTASPDAIRSLFAPPTLHNPLAEAPKFERRTVTPGGAVGHPAPAGVLEPFAPGSDTALAVDPYARAIAEIRAEMARQNSPHAVGGPAGTVGAGVSLPLPLFSSGPSREQRKRNEALDADYRRRLARLQALAIARRDSIRADSLRRDSLARRGIRP
jgi:hypothetical protein